MAFACVLHNAPFFCFPFFDPFFFSCASSPNLGLQDWVGDCVCVCCIWNSRAVENGILRESIEKMYEAREEETGKWKGVRWMEDYLHWMEAMILPLYKDRLWLGRRRGSERKWDENSTFIEFLK